MTQQTQYPSARKPVKRGGHLVPGLTVRHNAHGHPVFEVAFMQHGVRRRVKLSAQSIPAAITEAERVRRLIHVGAGDRSVTVGGLLSTYLDVRDGLADQGEASKRGVLEDRRRNRLHLSPLHHRPLTELSAMEVRSLIDGLTMGASAKRGVLLLLRSAIEPAVGTVVETNVARLVRVRSQRSQPRKGRALSPEQVFALREKTTETFSTIVLVMVSQGLRCSEAIGLVWGDVDWKAGTLTVSAQLGDGGERVPTKTRSSAATIGLVAGDALAVWRASQQAKGIPTGPGDLVFTTATGAPQRRRNVHRSVSQAAKQAGLNGHGDAALTTHDLRHTAGSLLLDAGQPLPVVSRFLRHANAGITATIYSHVIEGRESTASAAMAAILA